jgi:hypothetical protein
MAVKDEHRTQALARFHPPLPAPVAVPGEVTVAVLTPDVTAHLNAEVLQGTRAPYVLFAMSEPDWLTLARWQQDVLRYLEQLRTVVEFYRAEKDLPARPKPASPELQEGGPLRHGEGPPRAAVPAADS